MKDKRMSSIRPILKTQLIHGNCTGICVNCIHKNYCTLKSANPKLFCEEYEV